MPTSRPTPAAARTLAVLVAAVTAAAAVHAPLADARIEGPRVTSIDFACGALQDETDALLDEYKQESTTNARRGEILDRLREIGQSWYPFCSTYYGDITLEPASPCGKDADAKLCFPELNDTMDTLDPGPVEPDHATAEAEAVSAAIDDWASDPKAPAEWAYDWTFETWAEYEEARAAAPCTEEGHDGKVLGKDALAWCVPADPPLVVDPDPEVVAKYVIAESVARDLGNNVVTVCTVYIRGVPPRMSLQCTTR